MKANNLQLATFGGGCFWCIEAVFQEVKGVEKVVSGYSSGNKTRQPTYLEICSGLSGFAEVIQITFNVNVISYEAILIIFMTTHDPTTLNQQGVDRGTQYRSVIYYHNEKQKEIANSVTKEITSYYENPVVTEISALAIFYEAEKEHQNFYRSNQERVYCGFVITPKLAKLRKLHADKLK